MGQQKGKQPEQQAGAVAWHWIVIAILAGAIIVGAWWLSMARQERQELWGRVYDLEAEVHAIKERQ